MSELSIPAEQTAASTEMQCAGNIYGRSDGIRDEKICYEYKGYLIRVHFSGNKTLKQCLQNLAERGIAE